MTSPLQDLRHVRYYPAIGLSTVFRPLPKGKREKLDVTYTPKEGGVTLRFRGADALGIPEQTLLLALVEMAQHSYNTNPRQCLLDADSSDPVGKALWQGLHRDAGIIREQTVCFSTSWQELARRSNKTTGGSVQHLLQEQLKRLCETVIWEKGANEVVPRHQSYLVSWLHGSDKRVHLALNYRLASTLFGERYAQVSMAERLELPSDPAKAIHAFLSTALRAGHALDIGIDTLTGRLWPELGKDVPEGTRKRRFMNVRNALKDLANLSGWEVNFKRHDLVSIKRISATVRDMTGPGLIASVSPSYREPAKAPEAFGHAAFGASDVSGLFLTKP